MAGNMTAKDVQAFVLPAFTNEVPRLTDVMLPAFMRAEQDKAKASSARSAIKHATFPARYGASTCYNSSGC